MNYRMLSFDYSTKKTGYAVYDSEELKEYGLIDKSNEKEIDKRFRNMALAVLEVLDKYSPKLVCIEETAVERNVQVQRHLTRLQGVMYAWCLVNKRGFQTIRPSQWRSLVGINTKNKKRQELKQLAIDVVINDYGINPETDDVAEAILIGQAAINYEKRSKDGD